MLREEHQFKASKPTLPQALADDGLNLILFGLGHGDIRSLKPWQSQGKASRARDLQESVDKSAPKLLLQWRQRVARAAEVTLAQNQWEAGPALKTSFKLNRSSARHPRQSHHGSHVPWKLEIFASRLMALSLCQRASEALDR